MEQIEEKSAIISDGVPETISCSIPRSIGTTILVAINFVEGYIFRQHFEYLRTAVQCTPMMFDSEGFTVMRANGPETMITKSRFYGSKLLEYQFNSDAILRMQESMKDPDYNPESPSYTININTPEFINHIKSLTKRSSIRLIQFAEHPDKVICQLSGSSKGSESTIFLQTEFFDRKRYVIDDGIAPNAKPNAKTPTAIFCASCNDLERARLGYGIFQCYPNAVTLYSANERATSGRVAHWTSEFQPGVGRIIPQSAVTFTRVPISVIKTLKKMSGWGMGIVSVYSGVSGIVRIESNISCFGYNVTYLIEK